MLIFSYDTILNVRPFIFIRQKCMDKFHYLLNIKLPLRIFKLL